jgi:hypothetical protein
LVKVLALERKPKDVQEKMLNHFSFEKFKERLQKVIERM